MGILGKILGNNDRESINEQGKRFGKVVSILNQKGGVGKTTMTFNLAHALAEGENKVLCIDMDPQGNLSHLFSNGDAIENGSVFNLLVNSIRELKPLHTDVIPTELIRAKGSIDYICASQDLSGFELTVAGIKSPRQLVLKNFIKKNRLRDYYDFILIDGPPTLGLIVVNIITASDGVIVPFQPDQFSRKGLEHFHDVVFEVEEMGIGEDTKILGYIPNLVDSRRKHTGVEMDQINGLLSGLSKDSAAAMSEVDSDGINLFGPFPNKVQLFKASHEGKSVFDFKSKEYEEVKVKFREMARSVELQLN